MLRSEPHEYGRCAKLKGEQSSGDWNLAGRTVWKREQMAWMSLNYGFVVQLDRTTEWRTETGETWRSRLEAKLDSMPGPIPPEQFKDRRFEIQEAIRLDNELVELMKPRGE